MIGVVAKPRSIPRVAAATASALALLVLVLASACSPLPDLGDRIPSRALPPSADTRLGAPLKPRLDRHGGLSGFYALGNGLDAFVARLAFAEYADRSIDVQYYLFHDDRTGRALAAFLLDAADRGVRVRVLLDDMDMNGRDADLASIALHPNIVIDAPELAAPP
ncbi:MAG: hypothetical protein V2I82_08245, partial [Halieaceae bacterium]|nr:hypothetical protein [Halieaceae bacterium]